VKKRRSPEQVLQATGADTTAVGVGPRLKHWGARWISAAAGDWIHYSSNCWTHQI